MEGAPHRDSRCRRQHRCSPWHETLASQDPARKVQIRSPHHPHPPISSSRSSGVLLPHGISGICRLADGATAKNR